MASTINPATLRYPGSTDAVRVDWERHIQSLFEDSPIGMSLLAPDGRRLKVNASLCAMLGYSEPELLEIDFAGLSHPGDRDSDQAPFRRLAVGEIPRFRRQKRCRRRDGTFLWTDLTAYAIYDEQGEVSVVIAQNQDIEQQKATEQRLLQYQQIVDSSTDLMAFYDRNYVLLAINDANAAFFGRPKSELIGRNAADIFGAQHFERFIRPHLDRCLAGEHMYYERDARDINGPDRIFVVHMDPFVDESGTVAGVIANLRDVTERRRTEAQIERIKQQYETVLSTASEGIFGLDAEGRVTFVNATAEAMLGWTAAELAGSDMHLCVYHSGADGRRRERRKSPIQDSLAGGRARHVDEDVFWRKDGTSCPVEYTSTPIWERGRISGVVVTFHDISERLDTQKQIQASRERLRGLAERLYTLREQERSAIAREIHDVFGQELTALKIDLAWTRNRLHDDQADLAERIDQMITIADRMVGQTRTISSRLRPAVLDDLGLEAAIESLAEEFQKHTGWTCALDLRADSMARDPPRDTAIFRIVQEALTNAARHSGATEVDISLRSGTGHLRLSVRDNGRGIDPDLLQSTRSLGLFGMRERAGAFGGRVEIRSGGGTGTTILLTIPARGPGPARSRSP